jgi:hypothetical protein
VPNWLIIVLAVLLVLAVGGALARMRQLARTREDFERRLERANHDLAQAAAQDRGWDRSTLEAAARRIFSEHSGGAEAGELYLVEVVDRPGTDEDKAVFRVGDRELHRHLTLGRRDGEWVHEALE